MASDATLEDFLAYTHIKAFDVISNGHFRKHLSSCREKGDKWAIQMNSGLVTMQNTIHAISSLVAQLTIPKAGHVQRICKDVMSCAQPPVKVLTGFNVCSITGIVSEHCVDLSRPGKNPRETYVHPRFRHFFLFLWFCTKTEYIIRACAKQWLETYQIRPHTGNYTQTCEDYQFENNEKNEKLYQLFCSGKKYVVNSLEIFYQSCALHPALVPSEAYLNGTDNTKKETNVSEEGSEVNSQTKTCDDSGDVLQSPMHTSGSLIHQEVPARNNNGHV
jgi:hypothetical protein